MNFNSQHQYNTLDNYLKARFHSKVFKVALNGNFTCPNRDGTISKTGCIYCSESGSGDFAGNKEDDLKTQFHQVASIIHQKWKNAKYIVYFQANTNTYGPLSKLKLLFEEAITLDPNIVAISIATRSDCLGSEILDYLEALNKRIPVIIELGLQTIHQQTMKFLNLGYTLSDFTTAVQNLRKRKLEVVVHIINGLPNETFEMMIETVKFLNKLDIQGIKIHSLFVLKNTILGNIYLTKPFKILSQEEYIEVVTEQLAHLNENIVIHRLSGDAPAKDLIEPKWSLKKLVVMNEVDKLMKAKNYTQGIKNEIN